MPLLVVLAATLAMWGCGMGVTELPSNTQPGGPGFLSITTQQISDGVQGVPYSTVINTTGGSGRLTTCRVATGTLPAGFSFPVVSGSTCSLTTNGALVTGAPGKYTFTLEAGDSSTPQRTDQRVYSLTIRPQFTVNPPVVLDGVAARSYTRTFTVTTNLQNHTGSSIIGSAEAGNGPVTQCVIGGLPAGFTAGGGSASCAADTTGVNVTVVMRAPPGTLAAGAYPFTISVTDSPIVSTSQAGVVAPASTATIQPTLVVRHEFSLTQATLAEAVQGRTYGVAPLAQGVSTNTVAALPPVNSGQAAEFGNGPLTSCSLSVTPADPALSVSVDPNNPSRCLLTNSTPVAAAGTYTVVVSATDNPIVELGSPGAVVVPANSRQEQLTWTVAPPISYSLNFDSAVGQPGRVPDATQGRTYGAPAKTSLLVTATGGLSATDGLSVVQGGTLPSGVSCVNESPSNPQPPGITATLTCSSNGQLVGTPSGATNFTVTVSDAGNSATPGGSISSDVNGHPSHLVNVDPPLGLAVNLADPLPPGVSGRPYGVAPAQPLLYTASGGLGGYTFTTPAAASSPGPAFPLGIGCAQGTGSAANTFGCSAASITATGSSTASYGPVPVTLDDTANPTTPDGASSATTATQNRTLAIEPPLSITPVAGIDPPPPGVQGRTYGSGAGFAPLAYVISGGDPPYTNFVFPPAVPSPVPVGGSTPEGGVPQPMACTNTVVGTATEVICSSAGAPLSAAPSSTVPYQFSFSVSDSGSGETAAKVIALVPRTITINAPLNMTGANPTSTAPPPGVQNRSYGGAGFTPLTYNATGGIGAYSFTPPAAAVSPGSSNTPASIACTTSSGTQVVCTSGASTVTATPGNYSFSITVNDTADATTPGSQASNTSFTLTEPLAIEPPLAFTPNSQSLVTAVLGRPYGQGPGCTGGNCLPFTYVLSGGLGGYQPTIASSNNVACALQVDGKTYQCSSASVTGPPSTPTLNLAATDTGNASTPSGAVSSTQATATATLPINAAMAITAPSALQPGVTTRAYGSGSTCGPSSNTACQPIVYSVSGGLGGYSTAPTLNGYPAGYTCGQPANVVGSPPSATYTCLSTGVTGSSGSYSTGISASDTGNASTPPQTVASIPSVPLTIYPEITVTGPSSLAAAVNGRTYGVGAACGSSSNTTCQPISYNVNGGLGGYSNPPTLNGYPTGLTCGPPTNGTGSVPSATYTCSSSGVTGAPNSYTLGISVSDTANASTPAITSPRASNTAALVVDQPLTLTAASPATWASTAVAGSSYGSAPTGCTVTPCAPIVYNASGGLGVYQSNPTVADSLFSSISLTCSLSSNQYQCSSGSLTTTPAIMSPALNTTLTVSTSDVANASTPSGTSSNTSVTLTLNPALQLLVSPPNPPSVGPPSAAVTNRSYGTAPAPDCAGAAACAPLQFTAEFGTGTPYTFTDTSSLATGGFSCTTAATTYTCSSTKVLAAAGTISLSGVSVKDTANASVQAASPLSIATSLTVGAALALATTSVAPPALIDYNNPSYTSNALAATGGLPAYSWVAPGGTSGGCAPPSTPAMPAGLALDPTTGIFTGTATKPASAADTDFSFGVCVTDLANAATPAGAAYSPPGAPTSTLTLNVLNRYAFIADTGSPAEVRVINTGDNVASPVIAPSIPATPAPAAQSNMQGPIAVTPNGLYAFVPLTATNGFAVIDTITNTVLPNSPFKFPAATPCTGPVGVAFSADSQNAFFACSGNNEVVEVGVGAIAGASGAVTTGTSSAATTGNPTAIASTSVGPSLFVVTSGSTPEILVYNPSSLATAPATAALNPGSGFTPDALALAVSGSTVTAFIAETTAAPTTNGEFQVVTYTTSLAVKPPVAFASYASGMTTYFAQPVALAVTPDGSRVYVALSGTNEFALITVASPASAAQYSLPDVKPGKVGNSVPAGVAIPPLASLSSAGYRVFFTSVHNATTGEVDIVDDNKGASAPTEDATLPLSFGASSTPQGIANIPIPAAQ